MGDPTLQEVLHNLRKQIDACIHEAGRLKLSPNTEQAYPDQGKMQRELALVYTKLQEAKMWAGKCLEQIGSELPVEFQDKATD